MYSLMVSCQQRMKHRARFKGNQQYTGTHLLPHPLFLLNYVVSKEKTHGHCLCRLHTNFVLNNFTGRYIYKRFECKQAKLTKLQRNPLHWCHECSFALQHSSLHQYWSQYSGIACCQLFHYNLFCTVSYHQDQWVLQIVWYHHYRIRGKCVSKQCGVGILTKEGQDKLCICKDAHTKAKHAV